MKNTILTLGLIALVFGAVAVIPARAEMAIDTACVKTAISVRDTSIMSAFSAFGTSGTAALTARSTSLQAAWDLTDKTARKDALKASWSAYKTATTSAREAMRSARQSAWAKFNTDRKACGVETDGHGSGSDASL